MSSEAETPSKDLVVKHFHKVESIGKTGKIKKGVTLSNDFSLMLKLHFTEFSFKMLAYVIKGYLIILKKNYENFSKELTIFLEFQLRIRVKVTKDDDVKQQNQEDKKIPENSLSLLNLNNFSLLSDTSQNDKLNIFSSDLAKQFLSTMKKMKKNSNLTLKSLYEGVDKSENLEKLVKNFSENLNGKKNLDFYNTAIQNDSFDIYNNGNNIFQENENLFSTYINFSMKIEDNNSAQNDNQNIIENNDYNNKNKNFNQDKAMFGFDDKKDAFILSKLGLLNDITEKKSFFKFDKEINYSPEEIINFLIEAEETVRYEQEELKNSEEHEISRENFKIYLNNYKKLSTKEETFKFEEQIDSNNKLNNVINIINNLNPKTSFNMDLSNRKSQSIEQFRTDKRNHSFDQSMQLSNLTINDVFDDKPNLINFNSNDKSKRLNFNDNNNIIIEEESNLNTMTYNYNRNAFQQMKSEFDNDFYDDDKNKFVNIDHEGIQKEIDEYLYINS